MIDDREILQAAARWSDAGLGVAVATVVSTWGSAPRPAGSQLAVNERGEFVGSVSGGCVEAAVIGEALAAIRDGRTRALEFGVGLDRAWEVGLACGGTIEVFVAPADRTFLAGLLSELEAGRPVVVATDLATGAQRLIRPFDDPCADDALRAEARAAAEQDRSRKADAVGSTFLRAYNPRVRVVIVGAVHVSQALAAMVRLAGYDAVVVDPRRSFLSGGRFGDLPVVNEWPDAMLARSGVDRRTAIVTLTHDPKIDDPALAAALRSEAFYVGALGSRRTQAQRRERLRAMGFTEDDLARIHGPVGLPIGAISPGEIAVSILAEIVARVRAAARPARSP